MPGFDGTGPRGLGPMTGRGEGYCAIVLPAPGTGRLPYGYAGLAGTPVQMVTPPVFAAPRARFPATPFGQGLGWHWGQARGRWR